MNILDQVAALPEPERTRVENASMVMLALQFSELAKAECEKAERDLVAAMSRAEHARAYLDRTIVTLENALRLHAMGRV